MIHFKTNYIFIAIYINYLKKTTIIKYSLIVNACICINSCIIKHLNQVKKRLNFQAVAFFQFKE